MAYVPGFDVDVFISYSHADNNFQWVTNFEKSLKDRLHEILGREPEVWRDPKLSGEQDFTEEIKSKLESTAVLVLVVSPSYHNSDFCRTERSHFQKKFGDNPKIGTRSRVVKAIKYPSKDGRDRALVNSTLGFDFYDKQKTLEYFPGDRDFVLAIDNLAKGLANILEDMHNAKTPVYVAEPAPAEAKSAWNRLCGDLKSKGFRVLPATRLDPDLEAFRELILLNMESAASSVHLLGPTYEEFAHHQLNFARDLRRTTVVWLPPGCPIETEQQRRLDGLAGFQRLTVLRTEPHWNLADIVVGQIRSQAPKAAQQPSNVSRIYLICDRKNPIDSAAGTSVANDIRDQEGFEVFLPEVDRDASILDEKQQERLATCDGVLLYWGHSRKEWFWENYGDIVRAERRRGVAQPYKSRAILLGQPETPEKNQVPSEWVVADIEAFLKPLRAQLAASGD
jgi:hypothetical protein